MLQRKLTVAELANKVGVSKSAIEKYLAGPSSPRAATIVAICREFEVPADWLLFGYRQRLQHILLSSSFSAFQAVIHEMKQPGELSSRFSILEWGSPEWRNFVFHLADERANELNADVVRRLHEDDMEQRAGTYGIMHAAPMPIIFNKSATQGPDAKGVDIEHGDKTDR